MNDWKKGLALFGMMLSPFAVADWQLDVAFALSRDGYTHEASTSVSLLPGEETILFSNDGSQLPGLLGKAELIEFDGEQVKICLQFQEQCNDGSWRTIASPTFQTGLHQPLSFDVNDSELREHMHLKVEVTSV